MNSNDNEQTKPVDGDDNNEEEEDVLEEVESVDEDTLKMVYNSVLNKKSFFDDSDDDSVKISNKKNKKSNDTKNKKMSLSEFLKTSEKEKPKKFVSNRIEKKTAQLILIENTSVQRYFNPRKAPFNLVNNHKNRNVIDTNNDAAFPKLF